ncbi:MAG: PH domain-containing protein, partial [Chloroflexi bacterium]|nr:PH domain-containing protein [Chloroflexota bacterium]
MADVYVDSMLADGERIQAEARQHWMALIRFARQPILVFGAAIVGFLIGTWLTPDGTGLFSDIFRWIDTLLGLATAGLFILALVWFPIQVVRWLKRRYLVTDRRVLYVEGVLRRNSRDAGLQMITDVGFSQTFIGRKMGFGDLVVATAANRPLHFRQMRDAIAFKKVIMA